MYFIVNGLGQIFLSIPEIERRIKPLFQTMKNQIRN